MRDPQIVWDVGQQHGTGLLGGSLDDWSGWYIPEDARLAATRGALFAVADGGANGAGFASRAAIETMIQRYYLSPGPEIHLALAEAFQAAHERVLQSGLYNPAYRGAGTTLTALVLRPNEAIVAYVGDSRAYLSRLGWLWPLTRDHTWVNEEMALGRITPSQAEQHPHRHLLSRFLGQPGAIRPTIKRYRIGPDDTFLLCTDGVSDQVWEQEMGQLVGSLPPPLAAYQLVALAHGRGGQDSASAVVVRRQGAAVRISGPMREAVRHDLSLSPSKTTASQALLQIVTGFVLATVVMLMFLAVLVTV